MASLLPTLCSRRWRIDDRAEVQAGGCSALAILCESQAGRRCAQGKDALAAVLRALAAHPEAPAVQASGCAAIANLVLEEGEAAVLAAGAIGAVIKALAAHPEAVAVQAKGCLALGNIAGGDAGEAEAVRCGAVAAAFDALRAFATTPRWRKKPSMRSQISRPTRRASRPSPPRTHRASSSSVSPPPTASPTRRRSLGGCQRKLVPNSLF